MAVDKNTSLLIRAAHSGDASEICEFLLESSFLYPDIESWWKNRVFPSLNTGHRVVLVVDSGSAIEGLFIGKPGISAKLCTLRLRESIRNRGVGRALVTEGLGRLLSNPETSNFYVTVSEAAEKGCQAFFEGIGFRRIAVESSRYRTGVDEFIYACSRSDMATNLNGALSHGVERTLFGTVPLTLAKEQTLVMSLRPEYASMILQGRKTIEFRRRFSKAYEGATILFYVTLPMQRFTFTARVAHVDHLPTETLWEAHRQDGGIAEGTFHRYFSGTAHGYAIRLTDVREVRNPMALRTAKELCPGFRPPQSFQRLSPESPLLRALQLPVHV